MSDACSPEVQFLSSGAPKANQKVFKPADYYGERYTIVSSVRLDDATTKELKNILRDHTYSTATQAACHDPGQVLRFYVGSHLLLEMSLCFDCSNVEFYAYPFLPTAVTIFDAKSQGFKLPRLEAIMETIKKRSAARQATKRLLPLSKQLVGRLAMSRANSTLERYGFVKRTKTHHLLLSAVSAFHAGARFHSRNHPDEGVCGKS
jgi:hypothetical protein